MKVSEVLGDMFKSDMTEGRNWFEIAGSSSYFLEWMHYEKVVKIAKDRRVDMKIPKPY